MGFWENVFDWANDHPFLTTGLVAGGGYATYKLGSKALDVAERTGKRAIRNRYSVKARKVFVGPCNSVDEEMIVDEEGCLAFEK